MPNNTSPSPAKPQRPNGHLSGFEVLAGLAVGIGAIWFMASGSGSSDAPKEPAEATPFMAFIQCKAFVQRQLKAPATAQFPAKPLSAIKTGDRSFIVTATVDAQNGFGALIRNDWLCKTTHNGGNPADPRGWVLDSLTMQ